MAQEYATKQDVADIVKVATKEILDIVSAGTKEILEMMQYYATGVDERFVSVESRLDAVESRLDRIESTMVTKDYWDHKLADFRGEFVSLVRQEDDKFTTLVEKLNKPDAISDEDAVLVLNMEPFRKTSHR